MKKINLFQKLIALACASILLFPPFAIQAIAMEIAGNAEVLSSIEMQSIKGGNEPKGSGSTNPGSASTSGPPQQPDECDKCDQPPQPDPVLLTGGKFYLPEIDVAILGRGRATENNLQFERHYSSREGLQEGACGAGWVTNLDIAVYDSPGGTKSVREHEGTIVTFTESSPGVFTADATRKLEQQGDGTFLYTKTYGTKIKFNSSGRPEYIEDRNGNRLLYAYVGLLVSSITDASGRTLTFTYHPDNRLATVTDPLGRVWSYAYDTSNNLISVTKPLNRTITYGYNDPLDPHNITSITDAKGNVTLYDYNVEDRVIRKTKPDGTHIDFSFNLLLGTSSMTDEAGNVWNYEYTTIGLTTLVMDPEGGVTQYMYDPVSYRMTSMTDALGRTTTYEYDANRNLSKITDPAGGTQLFTYDSTFNKWISRTDQNGKTSTRTLDTKGNEIQLTDPMGGQRVRGYDANGLLTDETDRNGHATTYGYDAHGNLVSVTNALGDATNAAYDTVGRLISVTDGNGNITQYVYDAGDRLIKIVRADLAEINLAYDANDKILTATDTLGHATTYAYNSLDLLIAITDALGNISSATYDARENLATVTDAAGRAVTISYDGVNRRIVHTDALNGVISFSYDLAGNLLKVTDPKGQETSYQRDSLDRLTKQTYPDGSTKEFSHDAVGNLLTRKNRAGEVTTFSYDDNNRPVSQTQPGRSYAFQYDAESNRTQVNDSLLGNFKFVYDELNRLKKAVQPGSQVVQYRYNKVGLRKKLIYPDATEIEYRYDNLNRLRKIIDGTEEYYFNYDVANRRKALIYPNGIRTKYQYDDTNRLTQVKTTDTTESQLISRFDYTVNAIGNWTSMAQKLPGKPLVTTNYTYDNLDRLTDVAKPGLAQNYVFDAVGNRVTFTENAVSTSYTANNLNQYTQVGSTSFTYDAQGNLTNDGTLTMTYDTDNRLTQVVTPSGVVTYTYDVNNRLVEKNEGGATTRYVYDGWNVIAEVRPNGTIKKKYIHGSRVDEILADKDNNTLYLTRDGLGSTRELTRPNGSVAQRFDYDPFGAVTVLDGNGDPSADTPKTRYLFTGRELQSESGLYNYRNRFYHPAVGRFLQPDPIGFLGGDINLYTYVINSPINYVDPDGTDVPSPWVGRILKFLAGKLGAPVSPFTAPTEIAAEILPEWYELVSEKRLGNGIAQCVYLFHPAYDFDKGGHQGSFYYVIFVLRCPCPKKFYRYEQEEGRPDLQDAGEGDPEYKGPHPLWT